jgi:hypothetical protein
MTEEQLRERLQKLWVQATGACGSATADLVAEIREIEIQLKDLEAARTLGPPE